MEINNRAVLLPTYRDRYKIAQMDLGPLLLAAPKIYDDFGEIDFPT